MDRKPTDTKASSEDASSGQVCEITPEMVEAGISYLEDSGYLDVEAPEAGLHLVVREVFLRMLACRQLSSDESCERS